MTNEEIIKIIVPVAAAILSGFSKSIFDRIFAEYKPDIKKMKSLISFLVLILFRFIIPFIVLVVLYFKTETIDKIFVVSFSTVSFVLIFNIFYDVFKKYVDKKDKKQTESQLAVFDLIVRILEKGDKTENRVVELYELMSKHISITENILDKKPNT